MRARWALLGAAALVVGGCSPAWKRGPHDRLFQRESASELHPPVRQQAENYWWERAEKTTVTPLGRALSPGTYVSAAIGGRDAFDVNAFGEVPDSGWYENRIGRLELGEAEAARGAASDPPAEGQLQIASFELKGASPRFVVLDSDGVYWLFKADPPAHTGVSTSAEIIASRLLWLAGYHVLEMHLVDVDVSRLELKADAWTRDEYDDRVPMTRADQRALIAHLNPDADGLVRILATRYPDGLAIGPFSFEGQRIDDPNDRIPHEMRRSLRGLWLFFAWLNNTDARGKNTLDVHLPRHLDGRGTIRHYLADFADCFGAADSRPKDVSEGATYLVDWGEIGANLVTLGIRSPDWLRPLGSGLFEVGLFRSEDFEPDNWKPRLPNPAFAELTRDDLFWAGRVLARIEERHVRGAVSSGAYRNPRASEFVTATLMQRRAKLLRYAFSGQLPLDRPRVTGATLTLDDLRPQAGLRATALVWRVRWNRTRGVDQDLASGVVQEARIDLAPALSAARARSGFSRDPFLTIALSPVGGGPEIQVHLRAVDEQLVPIGLQR